MMKPLPLRRALAGMALLALSGSGWALPINEQHFINANVDRDGKEGKEVGYSHFQVTGEGYFNVRAVRSSRNAFVNPFLYLFGNALAGPDLWRLVGWNDDEDVRTPDNSGYNSRLDRVFLGIGNYVAAVSDIGGPQTDEHGNYLTGPNGFVFHDFTEAEARGGYNPDVLALGNRFGRVKFNLSAPRRPNDGRSIRGLNPEGTVYTPDARFAVPEPATVLLLGSGFAAFGLVGRRRAKSARRGADTDSTPRHRGAI